MILGQFLKEFLALKLNIFMTKIKFNTILAMSKNFGIGKDG